MSTAHTIHSAKKLLTVKEAADVLGVAANTLRIWDAKGILQPMRTPGGQRRYTHEQLQVFSHEKNSRNNLTERENVSASNLNETQDQFAYTFPLAQPPQSSGSVKALLKPAYSISLAFTLLIFLASFALFGIKTQKDDVISQSTMLERQERERAVLQSQTKKIEGDITFNLPALFHEQATFSASLTAPNILYSLSPGLGISITDGQAPTASNSGILSLGGATGSITLGSGLSLSNNTLTNSSQGSNTFKTLKIGSDSITAGSTTDTFEFASGTGVTFSTDTTNKKLTISGSAVSGFTDDGTVVRLTTSTDTVGIGTTAPDTTLHVAGTFKATGATTLASTLGVTGATTLSSTLGVTGATTLSSTLGVTGASTLSSTLGVTGATTLSDALTVSGTTTLNGNISLGNATTDTITYTGRIASSIVPSADISYDLGSSSLRWQTIYANAVLGGSSGTQGHWQRNDGALSPANITDDFIVGTTATSSAVFQVIGTGSNAGNTTIKGKTTLGDATGDTISIYGYITAGNDTLGNAIEPSTGSKFDLGSASRTWRALYVDSISAGSTSFSGTNSDDFRVNSDNSTDDTESSTLSFERGSPAVNAVLKWNASGTPSKLFSLNAPLFINPDSGISYSGTSALIVNQIQSQDILTASASGTTRFRIANTGELVFSDDGSSYYGTLDIATLTASRTYTFPDAAGTVCLSGQSCATSGIVGYWQRNNGSIAPTNISDDILLGATASTSAKVAFLNMAAGTPIASISATTTGLSLGGDGTIQSLRGATLSLGGTTTGLIDILNKSGTAFTTFDTVNSRLGVGTATPATQFHVSGAVPSSALGAVSTSAVATAPQTVYVQGRYLYVVTSGNSLAIYDVSNPSSPASVGSVSVGTTPRGVHVQGRYAYAVSNGSGLQVIDVSNPASPAVIGTVTAGSNPYSVYVQGQYAYVVNYTSNTLQIFDVSNPSSPVSVGSASTTGSNPRGLYIQGRYAYVTASSPRLQIFDVSVPTSPTSVGSTGSDGTTWSSVYVQGRYAYGTTNTDNTLNIVDVSNPTSPSNVSSITTTDASQGVYVQGRYAYVVTSGSQIRIYDVSNPSSLSLIGTVTTATNPGSIFVQGRYGYTAANTATNTIHVWDLGGGYIQQLETGGLEAGTIQTRNNLTVNNDAEIRGGLVVGRGLESTGPLSVFGGEFITGAVTGKALAIFNETGDQTILTASASGTTRFTLANNGTIAQTTTATTQTAYAITASSLSSGTGLSITGPTSTGITGASSGLLSLSSDVGTGGTAGQLVYLAPDFSASSATTGYGINIAATDSTTAGNTDYGYYGSLALTGNAAKTGYGLYQTVTSTSTTADTLYGADILVDHNAAAASGNKTLYGIRSQITNDGITDASGGNQNIYAGYFAATGNTGDTATTYGIYVDANSGDTSYGLYIDDGSGTTDYGIYQSASTDDNYFAGNISIGTDTTPDNLLDITSSATTANVVTLSATALSSGTALNITGPSGDTAGVTNAVLKLSANVGNIGTSNGMISSTATFYNPLLGSAVNLYLSSTTHSSSSVGFNYGLYNKITDSISQGNLTYASYADVNNTANFAKTLYGSYISLTDTSISTATGTDSGYGIYITSNMTQSGNTATINQYGLYIDDGTSSTNGTSSKYGIYIESQTGADTNYAIYNAGGTNYFGGKLGIGDTAPDGLLETSGAVTGKALAIFNETGDQNILTASASGTTVWYVDRSGNVTQSGDMAVNGSTSADITTTTTTATLFNTTATTLSMGGAATTQLNIGNGNTAYTAINIGSGTGGNTINLAGTGATGADTINIGTGGTGADTITIGNNASTTALNFTSGTGAQTHTSSVVSGTTTTSGFVFDATAITSGTGLYLTTDSIQGGKLAQIATTGNTLTTGTLLDVRTTATSLTGAAGTGSLLNLDWSPGSATTATGDLFALNIGTNGTTTGMLFNILDASSSIFSVSETAVATSLPASFTAPGDVIIAYDINFTNPTASYLKTAAPLYLQSGETFNSSDLTLTTYNKGNVIVDSEAFSTTKSATVSAQLMVGTTTVDPATIGGLYLTNSSTFGKALAILNQTESQPIFTASSSGTMLLTLNLIPSAGASGNILNLNPTLTAMNGSDTVRLLYLNPANANHTSTSNTLYGIDIDNITGDADATEAALRTGTGWDYAAIFAAGNVGIGTSTPGFALDLQNSQASTASAQIFNTSTNADADGLIVKLGNTSASVVATTNHFLSFETSGIGIVGSIQGNGGTGIQLAQNGIADFAEYLPKDENQPIDYASVVCLNSAGKVFPCETEGGKIAGVTSEHPMILGGKNEGSKSIAVGLTGQIPVKVSTLNGPISSGDMLTSSSIPGVAIKATTAGTVVGRALESYTASSSSDIGTIMLLVSPTWYDPSIFIASDGSLAQSSSSTVITNPNGVEGETILNQETTASPSASPSNNLTIEQLQSQVSSLQTEITLLKDSLAQNASSSAFLSQVMNAPLSIGTSSATLIDFETTNATISATLSVSGRTTLNDVGITGDINAGLLSIKGLTSEINTLTGPLYLQSNGLNGIDILAGRVTIDEKGNIVTEGTLTAKEIKTEKVNVILSETKNLDVILSPSKDSSPSASLQNDNSASIGTAIIKAGKTSIDVTTTALTPNSLIFATPDIAVAIGTKAKDKTTFTVTLKETLTKDVKVNWWVIN